VKSSVLFLLAACAASSPHPAVIALGDASMAEPARWNVERHADRITFIDPDRAVRVTIVANAGADAASAIAAAWQLAEPGFALAAGDPEELPESDAWDALVATARRAASHGVCALARARHASLRDPRRR
jgi:hypothetical protein